MPNSKKIAQLGGFVFLALALIGCGSAKRIESTEIPKKPMSNEEFPMRKAELKPLDHYFVQNHDCLWGIAGKPGIYGDSLEWPLLFKANRDEIKDPDLIYPRQDIKVEKGASVGEKNYARKMAMATPKYAPHTKPRATLPVDYF